MKCSQFKIILATIVLLQFQKNSGFRLKNSYNKNHSTFIIMILESMVSIDYKYLLAQTFTDIYGHIQRRIFNIYSGV